MYEEYLKSNIYKLFPRNKEIKIEKEDTYLIISMGGIGSEHEFYLELDLDKEFVTILSYSVAYKNRGIGLGGKLYDIFEEYIKSQGFKEIRLHLVLTSAEKFWKKKGFSKLGQTWKKTT